MLKMPRSNLTKDQRTALKELRGLEDEVILPADKGNATVMMRRYDYDVKMEEMLQMGTYGKLSHISESHTPVPAGHQHPPVTIS